MKSLPSNHNNKCSLWHCSASIFCKLPEPTAMELDFIIFWYAWSVNEAQFKTLSPPSSSHLDTSHLDIITWKIPQQLLQTRQFRMSSSKVVTEAFKSHILTALKLQKIHNISTLSHLHHSYSMKAKSYTNKQTVTLGPQRAWRVTQQISVLHMVHMIQSHPSFFIITIPQVGHLSASPILNRS